MHIFLPQFLPRIVVGKKIRLGYGEMVAFRIIHDNDMNF
jgi:hypothetical protein